MDPTYNRLFVSALGNNTEEIIGVNHLVSFATGSTHSLISDHSGGANNRDTHGVSPKSNAISIVPNTGTLLAPFVPEPDRLLRLDTHCIFASIGERVPEFAVTAGTMR
jgi:hypothetical protein